MKVTIGFSRPKKFKLFSSLVILAQGFTPYSHVYVKTVDSFTKKEMIYEASHGTIHPISLTNFKKSSIICEEFTFVINRHIGKELLSFIQESFQKKYGFLTILGIALNTNAGKDGDKTFICSEFAARILAEANLIRHVYDIEKITPKQLNGLIKRLIREKKLKIK